MTAGGLGRDVEARGGATVTGTTRAALVAVLRYLRVGGGK